MKTKKFLMTSLLVMGMIIAKAANGYPPELVLVSQPVLTYNANSVTIYYDVQNIGDFTYRGDLCIFLDPDNGHCFANKYMKVYPGAIKRISVSIPSYRINPSWAYTVMPYYELDDELYSFTVFEYFEPVRFCWHGYRNEPWVVIHVGPRVRYYHRPSDYWFYYDGYRPMLPPPGHGPGHPHTMPPVDPHHHTYHYHHSNGGYPANFKPERETPGYNRPSDTPASEPTARPTYSDTPGSTSSRTPVAAPSSTTTRPSTSTSSSSSATTRPSTSSSSSGTTRPSATAAPSSSSRPTSTSPSSSSSSRTGTTTRPSASPSPSSSSRSATSTSSSSSSSSRSATSTSSSSSRSSSGSSTRSSSSSGRSGTTTNRR